MRFPIEDITPVVALGRYAAKAVVGETVPIGATAYREGHDALGLTVIWRGPDGVRTPVRMVPISPGTDRWVAVIVPDAVGLWEFAIEAYADPYLTWHYAVTAKTDAGQGAEDLQNDLAKGAEILDRAAALAPAAEGPTVKAAAAALRDENLALNARLEPALDLGKLLWEHPVRDLVTTTEWHKIWTDRTRALFSAWYEMFPRSEPDRTPIPPAAPAPLPQVSTPRTATTPAEPSAATPTPGQSTPAQPATATPAPGDPLSHRPGAITPATIASRIGGSGGLVAGGSSLTPPATKPPEPQTRLPHGTFISAAKRLQAIANMGFDIVYLPPIHPIGEINRKGKNNALLATPTDVGSPWAIGSKDGGHDAIHPDLGTVDDFRAFVAEASRNGLEVALDLALQCAPDHPWVKQHPEWFTTLPDGTIAYAENPPKKYQDIYPLNFDNDPEGIRTEVKRVVLHWLAQGVKVFRVDNPHTKPVDFWHWLIAEVKAVDPDVLFLAEAFTRPAMMYGLGMIGFSQSYTYFAWRNSGRELREYCEELIGRLDEMRPNFWPTTPDILPEPLWAGQPAMFKIRAILAATLSPSWGIYSGYELFEHTPRPGSEEFIDNEKYEIKPRDWAAAEMAGESLAPFLGKLNAVRRAHTALHWMRNLVFHDSDNDQVLCYSKRDKHTGDTVIMVVSLDPSNVQWANVSLNMPALGFDWHHRFDVHDALTGERFHWGQHNAAKLDPMGEPAHILTVRR